MKLTRNYLLNDDLKVSQQQMQSKPVWVGLVLTFGTYQPYPPDIGSKTHGHEGYWKQTHHQHTFPSYLLRTTQEKTSGHKIRANKISEEEKPQRSLQKFDLNPQTQRYLLSQHSLWR
jgi:hypothetical protein